MFRTSTILLFGLILPAFAAEIPKLSVEVKEVSPPKSLKDPIRDLLSDKAVVVNDGKATYCTIWLRKEIPVKATADQLKAGINYKPIPVSTVVGVVKMEKPWTDFHHQEIPAGLYTMRFAMQPMDGNHQGTAPHGEFCLLSPADKDTKPDPITMKALNALSGEATGGTHPAVMLLFPNAKPDDKPSIAERSKNVFTLNLKWPVKSEVAMGHIGLAMTVFGVASE